MGNVTKCEALTKGVATKFCLGGRIHGHPKLPTPKIIFFLGFRPLYFENVRLFKKNIRVKKKVAEISSFLGGRPR